MISYNLESDLISPMVKIRSKEINTSRRYSFVEQNPYCQSSINPVDEVNLGFLEEFVEKEKQDKINSSSNKEGRRTDFNSKYIPESTLLMKKLTKSSQNVSQRFSFFTTDSNEIIHSPSLSGLVDSEQSISKLFKNPTWWLDCSCPTDVEMKVLAKAFGIHPLTAEDIRMQEAREKVELFRNYYFVCFHTFEADKESEDYLEPINVYMVVFREGILTFHFSPITHPANVRRRVRQLRDYVEVTADWLCYALIDDITDSFAPAISSVEKEADNIEHSVFVSPLDYGNMLLKVGMSRRKVMKLMRLLSAKADVIKMFGNRCQSSTASKEIPIENENDNIVHPGADIALYLSDIQDHVVTMFQNLKGYEKIFSRSHANYLAQLQLQSIKSNNRITDMISRVSLIGTVMVTTNIVTGLFAMNVTVPGEHTGDLIWFFTIFAIMIVATVACYYLGKILIDKVKDTDLKSK
ncbi:uncharacterized protein RJT21DRAFT_31868 [Scheffersomyces amazonensis]|uniref:uncharacterized protein n=1 Tax=Scheffersomyces amazonensis TaxID=1078765 RepID=UPI00315DB990